MRPQQDYRGPWLESYVPMEQRPAPAAKVTRMRACMRICKRLHALVGAA